MKNLFKILIVSILLTSFTINSDFCQGWSNGYCAGWKYVKGQFSVCPVTPVCPLSSAGCNTYSCGYGEGFNRGMNDAN